MPYPPHSRNHFDAGGVIATPGSSSFGTIVSIRHNVERQITCVARDGPSDLFEETVVSDDSKYSGEKTIIITEKVDLNARPNQGAEPYLIQISGRETGQTYRLSGELMKIGRDPACAIALDDPHISRLHAEIGIKASGDVYLRDIGSTNGVFVNGKRVTEHTLTEGDKILIGTRLYFKFAYQDAVDQKYQQNLFQAANNDSLTQLYNKKYFLDVLAKEFSFSRRDKQPLSLLMVDIDHFKAVNDTYGHLAGDQVLKAVGQTLVKSLRLENVACRYGGEEFGVILRNVSGELAHTVAERLRLAIAAEVVTFKDKKISISVSVGVATLFSENFATFEDLLQRADEFLYEAKAAGRNRTVTEKRRAA